jgi:hypothetical protein
MQCRSAKESGKVGDGGVGIIVVHDHHHQMGASRTAGKPPSLKAIFSVEGSSEVSEGKICSAL